MVALQQGGLVGRCLGGWVLGGVPGVVKSMYGLEDEAFY